VSALSACDAAAQTAEDTADLPGTITSVRLNGDDGGVTLRGAKYATKVTVHRRLEYNGDKPSGRTYDLTGGVLELRGCGEDCKANYTVDLPAGLPVQGRTSNGAIEPSGMGRVDVHTTNGEITGTGLPGPVTAKTNNGGIDLTVTRPADVTAETSNGAIDLSVPRGGYRVSADTANGDKSIGVGNDPSSAHRLQLSTSNGAITVTGA